MYRTNFNNKFDWFSSMGVGFASLMLSVYAIYLAMEGKPMTQLVWILLVVPGIYILFSFYYGIKMHTAPRDTRLDDLIEAIKQLTLLNGNLKINIDFKGDTADISKMNAEQLKVTSDFMNQLREKQTK